MLAQPRLRTVNENLVVRARRGAWVFIATPVGRVKTTRYRRHRFSCENPVASASDHAIENSDSRATSLFPIPDNVANLFHARRSTSAAPVNIDRRTADIGEW